MNVKISSVQIRVYINRCFDNLFHAFFFTINLTINLECSGRGMQSRFVLNLTNIYQHESCKQPHGSTAATITSTIRPITLLKIQLLLSLSHRSVLQNVHIHLYSSAIACIPLNSFIIKLEVSPQL